MSWLYKQLVRSSVFILVFAAFIFIPAGTLHYWRGWAYLVAFIIGSAVYTVYLAKHDPALLKRRTEVGISHEKERTQKIVMFLLYMACLALVVLSALDFRFGWSQAPWYVPVFGDALIAVSFYVFYLVSKVNTYAAGNIRVEEGQTVILTGLYGFVRHPMYLGSLFFFLGTPLALGSLWALLFVPLFMPILYFRIANEEKVLLRNLQGYAAYKQKVRSRLIPGVF